MKDIIKNPALIPGLLYFLFNATTSYSFYHVNSYKMVVLSFFVVFLFLLDDVVTNRKEPRWASWKIALFFLIPPLFSIPGYFIQGGAFNYNFDYELSIDIMMLLWAVYLFRRVQTQKQLNQFLFLIGLTFVYAMIWSLLEYNRLWMFEGLRGTEARVKGPFGNFNYFSAAIAVLFPTFFVMAISSAGKWGAFKLKKNPQFWSYVVFCVAFLVCIYLTSTRSAQAGLLLGSIIGLIIFLLSEYPSRKNLIYSSVLGMVFLGLASIAFIKVFEPAIIVESRYGNLFYLSGWIHRFKAWEAALFSIQASPIWGWGLGSSYSLYFQFVNPNSSLFSPERSFNHVHSEHLETTQEAGIVGALVIYGAIFWMIYKLFLVSQNKDISKFERHLAIGLISGIIAYNLHGFFSVAQRMVVAILPYVSVLTLSLVLINKNGYFNFSLLTKLREKLRSNEKISIPFARFGIPFLLLSLLGALYIPWAIRQSSFVQINSTPFNSQLAYTKSMIKLRDEGKADVYALDELANATIRIGLIDELEKTINAIKEVIPNYRTLGFKEGLMFYIRKENLKSREALLNYFNYNAYDASANRLLIQNAIKLDDSRDFPLIFERTLRSAFKSTSDFSDSPDSISLKLKPGIDLPTLTQKDDVWEFLVPKDFIEGAFKEIKDFNEETSPQHKQEKFFESTVHKLLYIYQTPFFELQKIDKLSPNQLAYANKLLEEKTKVVVQLYLLARAKKNQQIEDLLKKLRVTEANINKELETLISADLLTRISSFNAGFLNWWIKVVL